MTQESGDISPNPREVGAEAASQQPEKFYTGISIDRSNSTARLIEDAIRDNHGRVPYSRVMDISLLGPDGYYSAGKADIREDVREEGDFLTFPTREPFNQSVGESVVKVWEAMGRPDTFQVIEMGAGTGIMAKDMLVWARENNPEFYSALSYVILEYGDLREKQQATIGEDKREGIDRDRQITPEENASDLVKVQWVQGAATELETHFRDVEGVFLSNELPDTFPAEFVKKIGGAVKQKYVTLENDQWVEVWDDPSEEVSEYIATYEIVLAENSVEEPINLNAAKWQKQMDKALRRGAVITIDYGKNGETNEDADRLARRIFPRPPHGQNERVEYSNAGNYYQQYKFCSS